MRKSFVAPFVEKTRFQLVKAHNLQKGSTFCKEINFFLVILMRIKGQLSQEKNFCFTCGT
jgi:hypothetical protein